MRTNLITVAKLAQFYATETGIRRPHTKSALIDTCLSDFLTVIIENKLIDESQIENEEQAFNYLMSVGLDFRDKKDSIPSDIITNMRADSLRTTTVEEKDLKSIIEKVDKELEKSK